MLLDYHFDTSLLDTSTGRVLSEHLEHRLPGCITENVRAGFLADIDGGLILYAGRPTEGTKQMRLPYRPHLQPLTKWSLKCADPATGHFVTLVDNVAYDRACYSPVVVE